MTSSNTNYSDFVGDWIVENLPYPDMSDSAKMDYYPPKGTILTFKSYSKPYKSMGSRPFPMKYYTITASGGDWLGKEPMQDATYWFHRGVVGSSLMQTTVVMPDSDPDDPVMQMISEVILLSDDKQQMQHSIIWQDRDLGKWTCTRKV